MCPSLNRCNCYLQAPLEKGYSQVDWLRLSKATPKHPLRKGITLAEVKLHNTKEDAWMVFRNRVSGWLTVRAGIILQGRTGWYSGLAL